MSTVIIEGLGYRYVGGEVLGCLSLTTAAGVYRFEAKNGHGKSTLLGCIAGVLEPYCGSVRVFGEDPWRSSSVKNNIGYSTFPAQLPKFLTVYELYEFISVMKGVDVQGALDNSSSLGLPLDLTIGAASSGQLHKAGIVAALIGSPALLLLDEVFANLDYESIEIVRSMISKVSGEAIVIYTSHSELLSEQDNVLKFNDVA